MTQESELPEELRFEKQEPPSLYAVAGATIVVLASIVVEISLGLFHWLQKKESVEQSNWRWIFLLGTMFYTIYDAIILGDFLQ